jgi:hypothetical protein
MGSFEQFMEERLETGTTKTLRRRCPAGQPFPPLRVSLGLAASSSPRMYTAFAHYFKLAKRRIIFRCSYGPDSGGYKRNERR